MNVAPGQASSPDLTKAKPLKENEGLSFNGIQKTGSFEIKGYEARNWLNLPNPGGKLNAEVLRPWFNGLDVTRRNRDMWIIDFGVDCSEMDAALYEAPYRHLTNVVAP